MRTKDFFIALTVTLGICAPFAQATHYQVATGLQGASGAIYSPDFLTVKPGDTIEFILIGVLFQISHPTNLVDPRHHRSTVYQPLLVFNRWYLRSQSNVN